jgi:hypothetical protein
VCDRPSPIKHTLGPLCVGAGLIADGLQLGYAVLEHRVGDVSDAVLDGVVQALEFGFSLGRTLAQFGDMRCSALRAFLPAMQDRR